MLKNEINNLFAPLKGILYRGLQVFVYIKNEEIFFCNDKKSTLNRDFLNELTATIGLVFAGNRFVYLDEYENDVQIQNVFIADKFGAFTFYKCITGFEKMSESLYVINSSCKYESSDYHIIRLYNDSYSGSAHSDNGINKPILSNGSKEFGEYIENINKDFAIVQKPDGNYNVVSSVGKIITESTSLFIRHSKDLNTVFTIEDERLIGLTLENNRSQTYKTSNAWRASRLFIDGDIEEYDGLILIYCQKGGLQNSELTYTVIDNENEIKSFYYFDLCQFNSITKKGILIQTFDKSIEEVWNNYDDEPDYIERIVDSGYALISFDGMYMGGGDDSDYISIGDTNYNPGCGTNYNSTHGIYRVEDNTFIETPDAFCTRIFKESNQKDITAIIANRNWQYGMYFNENKVLDCIADEITQLDYSCSDLKDRNPDDDTDQYDNNKSNYFKCIINNSASIIYQGKVIAENVSETKFISFLYDGQWIISDYILIATNNTKLLCHNDKILYELRVGESIKGACLKEDKAWFRINNEFNETGLLYENTVVFPPINTLLSLGFMEDGTPLIGVRNGALFMGVDKQLFFDDESKHFLSMCSHFETISAIAYEEDGEYYFVDEKGKFIEYQDENFDSIGPCAVLEHEPFYVFSFNKEKFVFQPDEDNEEDDSENYPYYDEPDYDYEKDTFYALGGDDYDSFRKNGGSIDDMMDGMGF